MATVVLAAEDTPMRAQLEAMLIQRGHHVLIAPTGPAAVQLSSRAVPDLVIVDVDLPGFARTDVGLRLRSTLDKAGAAILCMTDARELKTLRGFGAHVTEFVRKDLGAPAIVARAEALLVRADRASPGPPGRLIAVAGPKGGCGRTTVAVNVAVAIAAALRDTPKAQATGAAVVLLDGHLFQGDVDVHLDLRSNRSVRDLVRHAGHLDVAALEESLVTHRDGLRVLIGAGTSKDAALISPRLWKNILHLAMTLAETVVVDLGPGYEDERALTTLMAASTVLLVMTPEIGSVRNARQLLDRAPQLRLDRSRFRGVLNRAQDRANLNSRSVATALGVEQASLIVLPEGGPSTVGHINRGMPVVKDRRSRLGRELERLASSLVPSTDAGDGAIT
jgi:pilus assembly protein CpaE